MCVILAYIALGASVFATYQGWNFVDGLFFSFAVLGTIGLIDIPASSSSSSIPSSRISSLQNTIKSSDNSKMEYVDSLGGNKEDGENVNKEVHTWIHSDTESLNSQRRSVDSCFVVLCTCYLLIGLAIISMCVQLMEHTCRDILQRLATTRLMGGHGSWMFSVYGDNKRIGKGSGRYWTTSASESPNNSSSWQGLSRQNSRETSLDNLTRHMDASLPRTNLQGIIIILFQRMLLTT